MRKLLVVVACLQVVLLSVYFWQRSSAAADRGIGAGVPAPGANGDVNGDGDRDISDAIYLLSFLFSGGPSPVVCAQESDLNPVFESVRVAAPAGRSRISFGNNPDNICAIFTDPVGGPGGLVLEDVGGVRILVPPVGGAPPGSRLIFGPTDDCSIGIDPAFPGLVLRDPQGTRLLGIPTPAGGTTPPTLRFGPTDDCSIGIDPALPGLLLRDPRGIRFLGVQGSDGKTSLPTLRFGPTDDCSIGIDPAFPGLVLRDPSGTRLLGVPAPTGDTTLPTLRFGPTDDCSIGIDPAFPGLVLRDPRGMRLLGVQTPDGSTSSPTLRFGPTDDCSIGIDPVLSGLLLRDPSGIRILPASGQPGQAPKPSRLIFGPTDDCSIGVDPGRQGLRLLDPQGFFFEGGPVFATAFVQTSSRRFKREVQPIEEPLARIRELKGVAFRWDEAHGGQRDIGFIAEEVAEVLPEVVKPGATGESAAGVSYGPVVALAVEGVKAQQRQIDELRSRNAELEKELGELRAQMALIAARVNGSAAAQTESAGR